MTGGDSEPAQLVDACDGGHQQGLGEELFTDTPPKFMSRHNGALDGRGDADPVSVEAIAFDGGGGRIRVHRDGEHAVRSHDDMIDDDVIEDDVIDRLPLRWQAGQPDNIA